MVGYEADGRLVLSNGVIKAPEIVVGLGATASSTGLWEMAGGTVNVSSNFLVGANSAVGQVMITGGSTGIGQAAARRCVADGAAVLIADVNEAAGQKTAADLAASGGKAFFMKVDVTKAAEVNAAVAEVVKRYGRLDGAFNNAGIDGGFANTVKMTEEAFDRCIDVNLKGVWLCMKHEIRAMQARGSMGDTIRRLLTGFTSTTCAAPTSQMRI